MRHAHIFWTKTFPKFFSSSWLHEVEVPVSTLWGFQRLLTQPGTDFSGIKFTVVEWAHIPLPNLFQFKLESWLNSKRIFAYDKPAKGMPSRLRVYFSHPVSAYMTLFLLFFGLTSVLFKFCYIRITVHINLWDDKWGPSTRNCVLAKTPL